MKTSRRQFLASAAASAGAFGFPMIFSGCAAKYRANETVQVAAIGAAGRAVANINGLAAAGARIVALCDFAYAGAMTQCSLLGVAALFDPGRELKFDAAAKRFADSSAANARLAQPRIEA